MARMALAWAKETEEVRLALAPKHLGDVAEGVRAVLRQRLMQWQAALRGVPVAMEAVQLCSGLGAVHEDIPAIHVRASVRWRLFRPVVDALLTGEIVHVSPDHVGLHVGPFNASIARARLPAEFEYREDADAFVDTSMETLRLDVGASITFRVVGIETLHGTLNILGDMTSAGTG